MYQIRVLDIDGTFVSHEKETLEETKTIFDQIVTKYPVPPNTIMELRQEITPDIFKKLASCGTITYEELKEKRKEKLIAKIDEHVKELHILQNRLKELLDEK